MSTGWARRHVATIVAMRLTAWEEERLLVSAAAELARRHRAAGLRLNAPEAIALICDALFEAARAGGTFADVEAAGRAAVGPDEVLDGIRELVDEVRLEVLLDEGTRLVVLVDPLGAGRPPGVDGPGTVIDGGPPSAGARPDAAPDVIELAVTSRSRRRIRVSSHYPFDRVNPRLEFDREAARGRRLDLAAGDVVGWEPGETKTVRLVRYRGTGGTA
jgi:urease subunit gamma/beta